MYTSTDEVTSYLVQHAPTKVKAGNSALIQKIHEDQYDPNFALLFAVSAAREPPDTKMLIRDGFCSVPRRS